jgi:hypothetical protein
MRKPSDLCDCGHSYKQHRGKGGGCIARGYRGINTKETGEKGEAAIVDSGSICHCNKFTPKEPKSKKARNKNAARKRK